MIIGKANLSEWANFRGNQSSSRFASGVGRQCRNPHILDRNPCGSSSGSGAATSQQPLAAAALATETDWFDRVSSGTKRCRRDQAHGWLDEPRAASCRSLIRRTQSGRTAARSLTPPLCSARSIGPDSRDPQTAASAGHFFRNYRQFINPDGLRGARASASDGSSLV